MSPAGSPLEASAKHTEWTGGATCVLSLTSAPCLVPGLGTSAGLTGQALAAISLAEPDQQRQGQHKAWKFFSHKHVSLPVTHVLVNIYPQMACVRTHILYCICICSWHALDSENQ